MATEPTPDDLGTSAPIPDDLTAHGPWRAERVWHKHHERIPDRWEWLIEDDAGVVAILPDDDAAHVEAVARFIVEAPNRIDALSADVARLTAERDVLTDRYLVAGYERDEARALAAERDATVERLRSALVRMLESHEYGSRRHTVSGQVAAHQNARSVLADTAPTPEDPT